MRKASLMGLLLSLMVVLVSGCIISPYPTKTIVVKPAVPPPTFTIKPGLKLIIDTNVYYVPGTTIFFYNNSWYYYCDEYWYVSINYKGPWKYAAKEKVPPGLSRIPPGHLKTPPGHLKTPPGHRKKPEPRPKKVPPGHRKKHKRR